eukprot:4465252-Amphidinium_carterae.1
MRVLCCNPLSFRNKTVLSSCSDYDGLERTKCSPNFHPARMLGHDAFLRSWFRSASTRSARQQIADMRLRYLCGVVGALGSLEAAP